jgi:heme/copper-type cytochrome/quinol oxidase subunit 1
MFAYWLYLFGGLVAALGFLTPRWRGVVRLVHVRAAVQLGLQPGPGHRPWVFGLTLTGFGTILGSVNFITTIICMRAPGMTMFRMPVFTWTVLVTSLLVIIIFPVLAAALFGLGADRRFGMHIFDRRGRRCDALAAPVLVLRPPGGLCHRVAVLRDHQRGLAGLLPQADLRLQDPHLRDHRDRGAVGRGVGAPHVRHRPDLLPFFAIMTMLIAVPPG